MASSPITPWQIDRETMETVIDFILGGSKITADGDCSHKIKTNKQINKKTFALWKKSFDKPRQHIKRQRHWFADKSPYRYMSWTTKKAEHQRIDAFELWCWSRLLRVFWIARSNQSILKEINPEYSLEGLMMKLLYFGHLM